jgi:hypothetical protein
MQLQHELGWSKERVEKLGPTQFLEWVAYFELRAEDEDREVERRRRQWLSR